MDVDFNILDYKAHDSGIEQCWRDLCGEDWMYVNGLERWYHWSGTHWEMDDNQKINKQVRNLMDLLHDRALDELAKEMAKCKVRTIDDLDSDDDGGSKSTGMIKTLRGYVGAFKPSAGRIASVITMAQAQKSCPSKDLDKGNLLNLRNGTLDLDAIELRPHSKLDRLTYCLDYDYDVDAKAPTFEKFLAEIMVRDPETVNPETNQPFGKWVIDPELCALTQEMMGYSLTNDTKFEAMFWLAGVNSAGNGGNGKSTLIGVIERMMGSLAMAVSFSKMGLPGNYTLAKVPGKRVLFSTEAPAKGSLAEDLMKGIVSGEPQEARPIYGDVINFTPVCKCLWSMNKKPHIQDDSDGFWRRLRLIPFHRQFTDADKDVDLKTKLATEKSGILNFAIKGLRRLRENGALTTSSAVARAVSTYRTENSPVQLWIADRTEATETAETTAVVLYKDFVHWCTENGRAPQNSTNFGTALKGLVTSKRVTVGQVYAIRLLSPTPQMMKNF